MSGIWFDDLSEPLTLDALIGRLTEYRDAHPLEVCADVNGKLISIAVADEPPTGSHYCGSATCRGARSECTHAACDAAPERQESDTLTGQQIMHQHERRFRNLLT